MIMIDNSSQYSNHFQNINNNKKSYRQILVNPKNHSKIFEQIDMLQEDYQSLKSNSHQEILLRENY